MAAVVSLTTIPQRLASTEQITIKNCLDSLVNQSFEEHEVHINIPYVQKKTGEEYIIPDWLEEFSDKLIVHRTEDFGALTKSVPTVKRLLDPEAILIIADDDMVYHEDMVKEHIKHQETWKEAIVGYDGIRSRNENGKFANVYGDSRDHFFSGLRETRKVDIIQHYKSASYKRRYFENDFFRFVETNWSWDDDLLLAAYFSSKKRDRIVTYHESNPTFNSFEEWLDGVGKTFPIVRQTEHGPEEGVNLYRIEKADDNGKQLYKFIDNGY